MCEPTTAAVVGVGSAALNFFGKKAEQDKQHAAQVAQTKRSNIAAKEAYIDQLRIGREQDKANNKVFEEATKAANESLAEYHKQKEMNQVSANLASASEQQKLNDKLAEQSFTSQTNLISAIKRMGEVSASGMQAGQSKLMELAQQERDIGFKAAQIDATVFSATRAFGIKQFGIDLDQFSANQSAWSKVDEGPTEGPGNAFQTKVPKMGALPKKPGLLGPLMAGASGLLGGFTSGGGNVKQMLSPSGWIKGG